MQPKRPLPADRDDYVVSLLRSKGEELDDLDRHHQEGTIAQEYYLSCRRALLGAISELNNVLVHAGRGTERESEQRNGERK